MSLESALENAYKSVLIANESEVRDVTFLLAMQTTEEPPEKMPLPNITLTANARQEMVPNSGVYEVELRIEVSDAAVREDGAGSKLDTIFTKATRPLLYKPLPAMISQAGASESLLCFGQPQRGEGNSISFGEGSVTRSMSALFICSATI